MSIVYDGTSESDDSTIVSQVDEVAQGSVALAGAATMLVQMASVDVRQTVQKATAKLSRAAQLFRKYTKKTK